MEDECCWPDLLSKCKRIDERYGSNIQIPSDIASDIVEVFDEDDVTRNIFRFLIYILWLEKQPESFGKYLFVREVRSTIWEACVLMLMRL